MTPTQIRLTILGHENEIKNLRSLWMYINELFKETPLSISTMDEIANKTSEKISEWKSEIKRLEKLLP